MQNTHKTIRRFSTREHRREGSYSRHGFERKHHARNPRTPQGPGAWLTPMPGGSGFLPRSLVSQRGRRLGDQASSSQGNSPSAISRPPNPPQTTTPGGGAQGSLHPRSTFRPGGSRTQEKEGELWPMVSAPVQPPTSCANLIFSDFYFSLCKMEFLSQC